MYKIIFNPYISKFYIKNSFFNTYLQENIFSYNDLPNFFSLTFSININKKFSTNYNIIRSIYLIYVVTGYKPIFVQNSRKTTLTIKVKLSGKKIYSILTFFYFLSNSDKRRIISKPFVHNFGVNFSFHEPNSIFDFRDTNYDYHNWPFKIRVNFFVSSFNYYHKKNYDKDKDFDIFNFICFINFPRILFFNEI